MFSVSSLSSLFFSPLLSSPPTPCHTHVHHRQNGWEVELSCRCLLFLLRLVGIKKSITIKWASIRR